MLDDKYLFEITEKAKDQIIDGLNPSWKRAYENLYDSAENLINKSIRSTVGLHPETEELSE